MEARVGSLLTVHSSAERPGRVFTMDNEEAALRSVLTVNSPTAGLRPFTAGDKEPASRPLLIINPCPSPLHNLRVIVFTPLSRRTG